MILVLCHIFPLYVLLQKLILQENYHNNLLANLVSQYGQLPKYQTQAKCSLWDDYPFAFSLTCYVFNQFSKFLPIYYGGFLHIRQIFQERNSFISAEIFAIDFQKKNYIIQQAWIYGGLIAFGKMNDMYRYYNPPKLSTFSTSN